MANGYKYIILSIFFICHSTKAAQTTSTFDVTATVVNTCAIASTSDLAFGNPLNPAVITNQTTTINVTCTNLAPYSIGLSKGTNTGSVDTNPRLMTGQNTSTNTLSYGLYKDAAHTQAWGNSGANLMSSLVGSGVAQPYTVYGQVPIQTSAVADTYKDTITITVAF